jgi:hypothetical protein
MFRGLTGVAQKKGRTEAASGGRKSVVDAFVPLLLYHSFLIKSIHKKYWYFIIYSESERERGETLVMLHIPTVPGSAAD